MSIIIINYGVVMKDLDGARMEKERKVRRQSARKESGKGLLMDDPYPPSEIGFLRLGLWIQVGLGTEGAGPFIYGGKFINSYRV